MTDLIDRQKIKARFEPWLKVKGYSEGELNIIRAVLYEITIIPSAQPDVPDTAFGNMISRQAAIDAVRSYYDECDEQEESIEERIERLPSADIDLSGFCDKLWRAAYERGKADAVRWIPCSERLPTKKTEVIYTLDNHYVSTGYMTDRGYNGDEMELHWEDMESGALIYPEAWMPLPEPYKGGQDD